MSPSHRGSLFARASLLAALSVTACTDPLPTTPGQAERISFSQISAASHLGGTMGHVVVLSSESAPSSDLLHAIQSAGGRVASRHDGIGVLVVNGLSDADAASLRGRPDVQAANRDEAIQWQPAPKGLQLASAELRETANPADAFFYDRQWNMRQIQADRAWETTPRGAEALVCILDSGIDPTHIDLAGKVDLTRSASFIAEPDVPNVPGLDGQFDILDYRFHGTFVASQVTTNGLGMASVAPEATLCAVKVLNVLGTGPFEALIAGVMHATEVGADVINMSLGAYLDRAEADHELKALLLGLQRAILHANVNGTLVVAAAGNDTTNLDADGSMIHVPSQMLGVVSVSATGPTNQSDFDGLAAYSNFGRTGVTVAAPGGNAGASGNALDGIFGACSSFQVVLPFPCGTGSFLGGGDGTSFAAPHVAGLGAVVESAAPGDQIGVLLATCAALGADHIDGSLLSPKYGWGRIDVFDSVQQFGCGARLAWGWRWHD